MVSNFPCAVSQIHQLPEYLMMFRKRVFHSQSCGFTGFLGTRVGNPAKRVPVRCAQWMMRTVFTWSDSSSIRLWMTLNVTVVSTATSCDVSTVQQHYYKCWTSTLPRVARLCQIREASLVALRKISKIYACSHVSIVRLVHPSYSHPEISSVIRGHCTIYQVNSSRSAQYPC